MKKLRILVNSNAPWTSSGYGNQMADFIPLMKKEGYDVRVIAFYGLQGGEIEWKGVPVYPAVDDPWGADAMLLHNIGFDADITMTLQDTFVLDMEKLKLIKRFIPIVPIDHEPTPEAVLQRLRLAYRIITYSQFGHDQLQKEGLHSTYIPHTVDTDIFKPLDKSESRRIVETWCKKQIPDNVFVIGMIGENKQNPPRKSFQEALDAFKLFLEKKNPNSLLYIHTNLLDYRMGFPIMAYAQFLGVHNQIAITEDYVMRHKLKKEQMPILYNAFDTLLEPSLYEGFGVPPYEAQACGIPAIVNNFTALRNAVIDGETGYKVDPATKRFTPIGAYAGVPDVNGLYEALVKVHDVNRVQMGKKARKFIVDNYSLKTVWENKWKPFLEKIELEIYGKEDNNLTEK